MQPKNLTPGPAPRFIISGGGTGGHIFPAIAIADELKRLRPDAEFLFVGAKGKMEMEKVPAAGYNIEGLWISGLKRSLSLGNLSFPIKVMSSLFRSRQIIRKFRPTAVVGTGGYAGAPILYAAAKAGIPTLIQEPNAYAGLANRWLGKHVDKICVAYPGMNKFFPSGKLVITGNPVRDLSPTEREAGGERSLNVLLMGGSGGAKSLNEAMELATDRIAERPDISWTWQCGKNYYEDFKDSATAQLPNVTISAFVDDMRTAYATADLVIGRAGSTTIAEAQLLGKPIILVPSPWVAEDHQTKNARALVSQRAAVLVTDSDAGTKLVKTAIELVDQPEVLGELSTCILALATPGAVNHIAREVLSLTHSPSPANLTGHGSR